MAIKDEKLVITDDTSISARFSQDTLIWSNNYTTQIFDADLCKGKSMVIIKDSEVKGPKLIEPCTLTLDMLSTAKGRSWNTNDPSRQTIETIEFSEPK